MENEHPFVSPSYLWVECGWVWSFSGVSHASGIMGKLQKGRAEAGQADGRRDSIGLLMLKFVAWKLGEASN